MAAGGGISRFRGKKQPASQQPSDIPPTADDSGNSLPDGRPGNIVAAPGGVGDEQPANPTSDGGGEPTTVDAMEDDRPSTAFNAFGFDGGDESRPATSGSHGFFGGLNDMLESANDDDEAMMVGDYGGDYGGEYQQEYVDYIPQQDDTMGEEQVGSPAKENDYVIGEIGVDINQPGALQMLATTATLSQETATAKGSDAGGGGALEGGGSGGIGKFSKRRTSAPPTETNATAPPPDTMARAGAGTKSDISRGFDVDLMSKDAEDDTNDSGGNDDEVPLTIRTSDDDVDDIVDDLTEATANFGAGVGEGLRSDDGGGNQEPAPTIITTKKTSAYFNNQVAANWAQQGLPHVTVHQAAPQEDPPPRFDTQITNVAAAQKPLSKVSTVNIRGTKEPPTMTHGVTGVTKSTKKRANGGLLNPPHHGPAARVSLSPIPGTNNENQAKSRPDENANQAGLFSPINPTYEDEDDNRSIVIPPPAANENVNVVTMQQKEGGKAVIPPPHNSLAPMKEKLSSNSIQCSRSLLNQNTNGIGNKHTASSTTRPSATSASFAKSGALNSTTIAVDHRLNAPNDKLPAESEAMETEPRVDETNVGVVRRPRSNTIYTPPPYAKDTESTTPKASNVVNPPTIPAISTNTNTNNAPGLLHKATNNPTFHTDESFDKLLSQFVTDIQDGTDIFLRGQSDFLDIEVELSHAFAGVLRYKDDYASLLSEIEGIMGMAECSMLEVSSEQ